MTTLEINTKKAKEFLKNGNSIKIHSLLETLFLKSYNKTYYLYKSELYEIEELEKDFSIKIYEVEIV